MLVLQVRAGRLRLRAAGPALVRREDDDVVQRHGRGKAAGGVERVLHQQLELVALWLPEGPDEQRGTRVPRSRPSEVLWIRAP